MLEPLVVREGELTRLPLDRDGRPTHTPYRVWSHMRVAVAMHYRSVPWEQIETVDDLEFWYSGLVPLLKRSTAHGH